MTGSPTGSPAALRQLLKFAARKNIAPQIELFPMSQINEAIERLHSGQVRYRVVLKADFDYLSVLSSFCFTHSASLSIDWQIS